MRQEHERFLMLKINRELFVFKMIDRMICKFSTSICFFAGCIAFGTSFGINLLFHLNLQFQRKKNEHMTLVHMLHVRVTMIYIETSNEIYYNDKTIPHLGILLNLCPSINKCSHLARSCTF